MPGVGRSPQWVRRHRAIHRSEATLADFVAAFIPGPVRASVSDDRVADPCGLGGDRPDRGDLPTHFLKAQQHGRPKLKAEQAPV